MKKFILTAFFFCLFSASAWARGGVGIWYPTWQEIRVDTIAVHVNKSYRNLDWSEIEIVFDTTWFCSWSYCKQDGFVPARTQPKAWSGDCSIFIYDSSGQFVEFALGCSKEYRHSFGIKIDTLPQTARPKVDYEASGTVKPTARRTGMFFVDTTITEHENVTVMNRIREGVWEEYMLVDTIIDTLWIMTQDGFLDSLIEGAVARGMLEFWDMSIYPNDSLPRRWEK